MKLTSSKQYAQKKINFQQKKSISLSPYEACSLQLRWTRT